MLIIKNTAPDLRAWAASYARTNPREYQTFVRIYGPPPAGMNLGAVNNPGDADFIGPAQQSSSATSWLTSLANFANNAAQTYANIRTSLNQQKLDIERARAGLPLIPVGTGGVVPANQQTAGTLPGWVIPAALGVLVLLFVLGSRGK